jgi:hypothetical protein
LGSCPSFFPENKNSLKEFSIPSGNPFSLQGTLFPFRKLLFPSGNSIFL